MKLIFAWHADKRQSLGIKVSYKDIISSLVGMIKQSQSSQNSKLAISLQYLKKEARDVEHQSFYKLALLFLMIVPRHVQSTQNRKLVIFLPLY